MKNTKPTSTVVAIAATFVTASLAHATVISVNFREDNGNPNQTLDAATTAGGGAGIGASNWNTVTGGTGSASDLNDRDGLATTAAIEWSSGGMWGDGEAEADANAGVGNAQIQRGYMDDNQGAPDPIQINLTTIPFPIYDLVVYFSTDTSDGEYGEITATAGNGVFTGSTTGTKQRWGGNPTFDDTNSLRITSLEGDLTIDAPVRDGAVRHSVSGLQVIQVPEPSSLTLAGLAGLVLLRRRRS